MESLSCDYIREFMDSAEHGVVLFTMGFIFNAKVDIKEDSFRCQNKMYLLTFEVILSVLLPYSC